MNSKAQAAVTDALLLLLVVGILSTSLVLFSINYGKTVQKYITDQYAVDFETTALKTMLYSSIPRDMPSALSPNPTVYNSDQVDYLLAVVKEDYLDDAALNDNTKNVLKNASKIAFKPLNRSYDYMFLIQTMETPTRFVFLYINASNPDGTGREEYYCNAKSVENVQSFLESVGAFNPVVSGIKLSKINPSTKDADTVSAVAELAMWTGASFKNNSGNLVLESVKILPASIDLNTVKFDASNIWGCAPENFPAEAGCPGVLVCKQITTN